MKWPWSSLRAQIQSLQRASHSNHLRWDACTTKQLVLHRRLEDLAQEVRTLRDTLDRAGKALAPQEDEHK